MCELEFCKEYHKVLALESKKKNFFPLELGYLSPCLKNRWSNLTKNAFVMKHFAKMLEKLYLYEHANKIPFLKIMEHGDL